MTTHRDVDGLPGRDDPPRVFERRRASDKIATAALIISGVAIFIVAGLSVIALSNTVRIADFRKLQMLQAIESQQRLNDTRTRVDESCKISERGHLEDVRQLRQTYRYLLQLTPAERQQPLNRFIIGQLPRTEREARTDNAPSYCDRAGVGLPEPDPVIPKRPKRLRHLNEPPPP